MTHPRRGAYHRRASFRLIRLKTSRLQKSGRSAEAATERLRASTKSYADPASAMQPSTGTSQRATILSQSCTAVKSKSSRQRNNVSLRPCRRSMLSGPGRFSSSTALFKKRLIIPAMETGAGSSIRLAEGSVRSSILRLSLRSGAPSTAATSAPTPTPTTLCMQSLASSTPRRCRVGSKAPVDLSTFSLRVRVQRLCTLPPRPVRGRNSALGYIRQRTGAPTAPFP